MPSPVRQLVPAALLALLAGGGLLLGADLASAAAQADPVKRSRLALENGERAAAQAGEACRAGDHDKCDALVQEARESVELAKKSLDQSGQEPSRSPRFKDAEIRTRKILRQLEAVRAYVHPDDVDRFEAERARISKINDQLLAGIMTRAKKKKK